MELSKHLEPETLIRDFAIEQGCIQPDAIKWLGYETSGNIYTRIGVCMFKINPKTRDRYAEVKVSVLTLNCSDFTYKNAFWHEIAHATEWINDGTTGHGKGWWAYMMKRPLYALFGTLYCTLEYVIRNLRK